MKPDVRAEEARLLRFIRLPAKKKLEWLYGMQEFTRACMSKQHKKIWYKLREAQ